MGKAPVWACDKWGSPEHDWLDCCECLEYYDSFEADFLREVPVSLPPRVKHCMEIPGLVSETSLAFLYWLAMTCCPSREWGGLFLELGCFQGRSASVLGTAAKQRGIKVYTVDNFKMQHHGTSSKEIAEKNLAKLDLPVKVIEAETTDAAKIYEEWPGLASLIFIDSHHSPKTLFRELDHLSMLHREGVIALHDFGREQYEGYTPAIIEKFMRPGSKWRCLGVADTLIAFDRSN